MIVIKNIDYVTVDNEREIRFDMYPRHLPCMSAYDPDKILKFDTVETEIVHGRRFVHPDGTDIVIGMTSYVQDLLGIQYDAWDNMQDDYFRMRERMFVAQHNLIDTKKELDKLKSLTFFQKLKRLFKKEV